MTLRVVLYTTIVIRASGRSRVLCTDVVCIYIVHCPELRKIAFVCIVLKTADVCTFWGGLCQIPRERESEPGHAPILSTCVFCSVPKCKDEGHFILPIRTQRWMENWEMSQNSVWCLDSRLSCSSHFPDFPVPHPFLRDPLDIVDCRAHVKMFILALPNVYVMFFSSQLRGNSSHCLLEEAALWFLNLFPSMYVLP